MLLQAESEGTHQQILWYIRCLELPYSQIYSNRLHITYPIQAYCCSLGFVGLLGVEPVVSPLQ